MNADDRDPIDELQLADHIGERGPATSCRRPLTTPPAGPRCGRVEERRPSTRERLGRRRGARRRARRPARRSSRGRGEVKSWPTRSGAELVVGCASRR